MSQLHRCGIMWTLNSCGQLTPDQTAAGALTELLCKHCTHDSGIQPRAQTAGSGMRGRHGCERMLSETGGFSGSTTAALSGPNQLRNVAVWLGVLRETRRGGTKIRSHKSSDYSSATDSAHSPAFYSAHRSWRLADLSFWTCFRPQLSVPKHGFAPGLRIVRTTISVSASSRSSQYFQSETGTGVLSCLW